MIILGVDPGIASLGYGVIEYKNNKLKALDFGTFHTKAGLELPRRLALIHEFLCQEIDEYQPDVLSVEELFFNTNAKTALMVGHGRGVILLTGEMKQKPVFEYTPLQVKQAVVGYGRAEKTQVQQMVKMLLGLPQIPKPDDTADALAMAICHAHCSGSKMRGY